MPKLIRDTTTVFTREITPELRSPISLIAHMGQPLLFLVLFGSMLAGSGPHLGAATDEVWPWFVPASS